VARGLKSVLTPLLAKRFNYVEDQYRGYQPDAFAKPGHVYLAGTWASERYFDEAADSIREQFTFAAPPEDENERILDCIRSRNAVSVHVRRGDYVSIPETNERHGTCGLDYYHSAFEHIAEREADPVVYVFSDDPAWVQEHLKLPCPTVYVTHNVGKRNYEDLRLMAACRHFIIANSTFSWWGAWLGQGDGKIVVAPKRWGNKLDEMDDPVPENWIRR
jgi:hypothetical protein